jgi:hypothetical protein
MYYHRIHLQELRKITANFNQSGYSIFGQAFAPGTSGIRIRIADYARTAFGMRLTNKFAHL